MWSYILELCRGCNRFIDFKGIRTLVSFQIADTFLREVDRASFDRVGGQVRNWLCVADKYVCKLKLTDVAGTRLQSKTAYANDASFVRRLRVISVSQLLIDLLSFIFLQSTLRYKHNTRYISDRLFVPNKLRSYSIRGKSLIVRTLESECWRREECSSCYNGDTMEIFQRG